VEGLIILQFADGLNLVMCNTLFVKQKAKLVSYASDPIKSTVDYCETTESISRKFKIPK